MNDSRTTTAAAIALLTATLSAAAAHAAVLEEVVITAQKRAQNLQDVGVSVSAFSGEQMTALGITDATEIVQQAPGLQLNTWSPQLTIFNLRGVSQSNFMDNLEAPVAVFVDDAYIGSMNAISGQLFDISRVEVLRGPQGTLFGRNASGGLIHYVSRGASETAANGYVEALLGDYNKRSLEAAFGGSLSDSLRYRVAARREQSDGYIEATQPGVRDLNGADGIALRVALQVDFSDDLSGELLVKYSKDDDVPTGGYVAFPCVFNAGGECTEIDALGFSNGVSDPPRPFAHDSDARGFLHRDMSAYTAKFNWNLDPLSLVSITNYLNMDKDYLEDGDGAPAPIVEFAPRADYRQFTQEFRLNGETENMRWQAGLFYMDIEIDGLARTFGGPVWAIAAGLAAADPLGYGADPFGLGVRYPDVSLNVTHIEDYTLESRNASLFGQIEYDLGADLTLILGYRWSEDDKHLDYRSTLVDSGAGGPLAGVFGPSESLTEFFGGAATGDPLRGFTQRGLQTANLRGLNGIDYGDYAARAQLDWRVSDDVLLFASWNRGIKGGNWSILTAPYLDPRNTFRHDEEVLNAYEIGTKTQFAGGRARLNATLFYYDYADYQAFAVINLYPQVQNTDATNLGGEVELFFTPSERWDIALGLSVLDSEVDKITGPFGATAARRELPNAPRYSFNYLLRYNRDALGGNWAAQVDGFYDDDQFLEVSNNTQSRQDAGGMINARLSYTAGDERWSVSAWVKNLADEARKAYTLDLSILGVTGVYHPPRWYGLTARYHFGS